MRRTGVIVGVDRHLDQAQVKEIATMLSEAFPTVKFAVVSGVASVAFEWVEPDRYYSTGPK